jgi:hypothetical protein
MRTALAGFYVEGNGGSWNPGAGGDDWIGGSGGCGGKCGGGGSCCGDCGCKGGGGSCGGKPSGGGGSSSGGLRHLPLIPDYDGQIWDRPHVEGGDGDGGTPTAACKPCCCCIEDVQFNYGGPVTEGPWYQPWHKVTYSVYVTMTWECGGCLAINEPTCGMEWYEIKKSPYARPSGYPAADWNDKQWNDAGKSIHGKQEQADWKKFQDQILPPIGRGWDIVSDAPGFPTNWLTPLLTSPIKDQVALAWMRFSSGCVGCPSCCLAMLIDYRRYPIMLRVKGPVCGGRCIRPGVVPVMGVSPEISQIFDFGTNALIPVYGQGVVTGVDVEVMFDSIEDMGLEEVY